MTRNQINQIINLITLLVIIGIILSPFIATRITKKRFYKTVNTKLNTPITSRRRIQIAYTHETGKNPYRIKKSDGTKLEYESFESLYRIKGKVLADVYIDKIGGGTTEIDIILINNTGIYVIECKDTKAWKISGNEDDLQWIYRFSDGNEDYRYNPLMQNIGHIRALNHSLKNIYDKDCYTSIIVTPCKNIQSEYESSASKYFQKIISPSKLNSYVRFLIKKRQEVLTDEEVLKIYKYLHDKYSNKSMSERQKHINNIKNIKK